MSFKLCIYNSLILVVLILVSNCDNPAKAKFHKELSTVAILSPGSNNQIIFVYETMEGIEDSVISENLFVKDAKVNIYNSDHNYEFTYMYDESLRKSVYINKNSNFKFIPGEKYQLKIESDIGVLRGTTIIPDSVKIISPVDNDSIVDRTDVEIKWKPGNNSYAYVINIFGPPFKIDFMGNEFIKRDTWDFHTTSESIIIPGSYFRYKSYSEYYDYTEKESRYTVMIMALDDNFKFHLFDGSDIAGVNNGWGVFGSTMIDSVDIFVVKKGE